MLSKQMDNSITLIIQGLQLQFSKAKLSVFLKFK